MSDETKTINNSEELDTRKPIEPSAKTTKPPQDIDPRYDPSHVPTITQEQYKMGDEFARGGMGRILRATDVRIGREVALKESLGARGNMLARFYREAMVTARLQHPGIVPIYELGRWPDGQPFYSMRLVKGLPLENLIHDANTLSERIALLSTMISACEALAYAHSQRIVHRDLKPANILCGAFGETVVIDWGIAKDLASTREEEVDEPEEKPAEPSSKSQSTSLTMAGAVMGTPVYMPPEQAHGLAIDERADVYALGAILYEVLSGSPPYKGKTAQLILMDVIEGPPPPLAKRQQNIPPDLIAIVEKAMSRDPKDRYRNAGELANELRKFQTGQIVEAYQYTSWELVKRFIKRNLLAFIVGGVAAIVLAAAALYSYLQIAQARDDAEDARDIAVEQSIGRAKEAVQLGLQLARTSLDKDPSLSLRYLKEVSGSPYFESWGALRTIAADAISRGIPRILAPHKAPLVDAVLSPNGELVASASGDGVVKLWRLPGGEPLAELSPLAARLTALVFSPTNTKLAVSYGEQIALWSVPTGDGMSARSIIEVGGEATSLSFSSDASLLAAACKDGKIRVYESASGALQRTLEVGAYPVTQVSFSSDKRLLAALGDGPSVSLWDTSTWTIVATLRTEDEAAPLSLMRFAPGGDALIAAQGNDLFQWEISWIDGAPTFARAPALRGHEWPIQDIAFSPDGKTIASASEDRSIRLWPRAQCALAVCQSDILNKHKGTVLSVAFSSDGRSLITGSRDRTARIWDLSTKKEVVVLRGHSSEVRRVLFSLNEQSIVTMGDEPSLFLWRAKELETRSFVGHQKGLFSLDFSPDGKSIVTGGEDQTLRLWDVACEGERSSFYCGESQQTIQVGATVWDVFFSKDGAQLITALSDGSIALWSKSGERLGSLDGHKEDVFALDLSQNGELLASAGKDKTARIWDLSSRKLLVTLEGHTDEVLDVSFSMDQRWLASASRDGTLRIWEVSTGKEVFKTTGALHDEYSSVSFSPDGKRLALAGYSSKIQLFAFSNGALTPEGEPLTQHQGEIERIVFSPDGQTLASASWDSTARLWSLSDPGRESRALLSHSKDVTGVSFSEDGKTFAFVSEDKQLHVMTESLPTSPADLKAWLKQF